MKILPGLFLSLLLLFNGTGLANAQTADSTKYHIAVFLPLYLDSAFDASGAYRFDQTFPKYLNPGLEFYEGLEMAMDSLHRKGVPLVVTVFDTRSTTKTIQQILDDPAFSKIQLMMGYVNAGDMRVLASAAKNREIPFINVNFPNDGGVTGDPEFVILNSTLRAHCETIYKFIQRNWATSNIFYVRRATQEDDRLGNYFAEIEKSTSSVPLRMKFINLNINQDLTRMTSSMDSNLKTIVLVGSLDESFGKALCAKLQPFSKSYPMKILGMPTWDAVIDFNSSAFTDLEIYYTTAFYMNPADSLVSQIQQSYKTRFYSRPSDMVYRGYETTLHFGQLLELRKGHLDGSVGERKFMVFNDFDIQPVFTNSLPGQAPTLQYLENKKLHLLKKVNGNIVAVY